MVFFDPNSVAVCLGFNSEESMAKTEEKAQVLYTLFPELDARSICQYAYWSTSFTDMLKQASAGKVYTVKTPEQKKLARAHGLRVEGTPLRDLRKMTADAIYNSAITRAWLSCKNMEE